MKTPKRDDAIYKEIESFADYELTQCVAYEIAIRNNEVCSLKKDINDLLKIVYNEFIYARDNNTKFNDEFDKLEAEYEEKYHDDEYDNDDLEVPDFHKYFLNTNENAKQIEKWLNLLITHYWIRDFFEKDIIDEAYCRFKNHANAELYLSSKQEKRLREHGVLAEFSHLGMSKDDRVIVSRDIFFSFGGYGNEHTQIDLNKVLISQRVDSLVIPKEYDIRIDIKLNLALPLGELESYIKELKRNYVLDKGMIKTSFELLGEELQKADDISRMCTENKNGKEVCFDGREGMTRTQKLADMFFIYDMDKIGKSTGQILRMLDEYHDPDNIKKTSFHKDTLGKYKNVAIDYIENLRYKELLIGLKS